MPRMRHEEALRLVSVRVGQVLAVPGGRFGEEARRVAGEARAEDALMDAQRFFPIAYDSRNHPKVRMLEMMGEGITEYGRYIALLGILYDMDNRVHVGMPDEDAAPGCFLLADELDFPDCEALRGWLRKAAACGLIDSEMLDAFGSVASRSVAEQMEFRRAKAESGKKGGRPRKAASKGSESTSKGTLKSSAETT